MTDINEIILREFDVDHKIHGHTTLESLGGGVGKSMLCMALERKFLIDITDAELRQWQTVDDVRLLVECKLEERRRHKRPSAPSSNFMPGFASAMSGW